MATTTKAATAGAGPGKGGHQPADKHPHLPRIGRVVVNVLVLLVVVLGLFWLTGLADRDVDTGHSTCKPPDRAASERAVKLDRQALRTEQRQAARGVRQARAAARRSSTPSTQRAVQVAQRRLARATTATARASTTRATAAGPTPISLAMGSDPDPGVRSFAFRTTAALPGPRLVRVEMGQLLPADGSREIDAHQVSVWAQMDASGRAGRVYLCIPPKERGDVASGRFQGSVAFDDPRVATSSVPLVMTLSWTKTHWVLRVGLLVCLVTSWYVYFLRSDGRSVAAVGKKGETVVAGPTRLAEETLRYPFGFWRGYWEFFTSAVGGVTVGAGLVSAGGAFAAQYLASSTWTPSLAEWATFSGAVATAFLAGGTAGRLAKNHYDPETKT